MAKNGRLPEELTTRQTKAIAALLTSKDLQSAAAAADVADRTLRAWMDDPTFRAALKYAEAEAIDAAQRRLAGTSEHAISVILMIMANKETPASVRLRAATTILDQMLKLRQFAVLEERVAALEATVSQTQRA
jgi:hypothetical protein